MKYFNIKIIIFVIVGCVLNIFIPLFYVDYLCQWFPSLNYSAYGTIGDTIGGITSPIINLIGAILVYAAFKEQRIANEQTDNAHNFENIVRQIDKLTSTIFENDSFNLEQISKSIKTKAMEIEPNNLEDLPENAEYFENEDVYENTFFTHKYELSKIDIAKIFLIVYMMTNIVSDFKVVQIFTDKHKSLVKQFITVVQLVFPLGISNIATILKENNKKYYSDTKFDENTIILLIDDLLEDLNILAQKHLLQL